MADETKKTTLTDGDVKTRRGIGRRTFLLGAVGGTTAIAGCVPTTTGVTDSDLGTFADPVGNGRGTRRVVVRRTGITDSDLGVGSDPVGNGRGRRVCTDSDVINADPVGRGRRC